MSLQLRLKIAAWLIAALLAAAVPAFAQTDSELSQYTAAVAHANPNDRLVLLERFAMHAQPGPLKVGALEYIIWDFLRTGQMSHALTWANDLAQTDKNNAIAIAFQCQSARAEVEGDRMKPERLLAMAQHGLSTLPTLERPLGLNGGDFSLLKRRTYAMLNGAAGLAELRMKDHVAARTYLHNSLAIDPNNRQDIYYLALADLGGFDPNKKEGYWYLARAVNLSRNTPQGQEIARDARARYMKDGGSTTEWNQFLASTEKPASSTAPDTWMASANSPPSVATPTKHKAPAPTQAAAARPPAASKKPAPPVQVAVAQPPTITKPKKSQQPPPSVWADDTNAPPEKRKRRILTSTGPMSLGILMETSLAGKENRGAVVNSLVDMLRRLNEQDEAFVLTYDNNLVFEQDLTSDPKQLEDALAEIKPQHGAVLDDAVAFAAGHLARIAKYPNRVLLVISDGRNVDSQASPVQTSAEINAAGVRIFCIGVDVSESEGLYRLRQLAASTGGQSRFISTPGQFRDATRYIAQNIGIDFRF